MVVAGRAREGPAPDVLPERPEGGFLRDVAGDEAALGAEEGLVGAARDDVRALGERRLEGAVEAEDVGHVVHDDRAFRPAPDDVGHELDRLAVEEHALAEDDELGPVALEELAELGQVGLVGVAGEDGEVEDPLLAGLGVLLDVVEEGAHGLGAQVPAVDELVVHDEPQAPRELRRLPAPVDELDHALEDDLVGHLAADRPQLDVGAAEIALELALGLDLDVPDEIRPLVEVDLLPLHRPVLGVAARRVGDLAGLDQERRRRLRGDEVEAFPLPPGAVPLDPGGQGPRLFDE